MKRFTMIIITLYFLACPVFGQYRTDSKPSTKENYLQKSKNQSTVAILLASTGILMWAIAIPGNVSFDVLRVLGIGGGVLVAGSIPLFVAAGRIKKKARSLEPAAGLYRSYLNGQSNLVASIGFVIKLQ